MTLELNQQPSDSAYDALPTELKCLSNSETVSKCQGYNPGGSNSPINGAESDDESTSDHGFLGFEVAQAHLFFSFTHNKVTYPCALVHWFSCVGDMPSDVTGRHVYC